MTTTGERGAIGEEKRRGGGRAFDPKTLLVLHGVLLVLSLSGVMSKLASGQVLLSPLFIVLYGVMLVILAVYALVWQQVIKRLPLTLAYANRAITVVWGIVWGALFFGEAITPLMVVGAVVIICGIVLFATDGSDGEGQ